MEQDRLTNLAVLSIEHEEDEFENHAMNDDSSCKQGILVKTDPKYDTIDETYENEQLYDIECHDDECEQLETVNDEGVNFNEYMRDDTSRQFQVGCYIDLEDDLNDGDKESSKLHRRLKCTSCLAVFSSLEHLDHHLDTCEASTTKTGVLELKALEIKNSKLIEESQMEYSKNTEEISEIEEDFLEENSDNNLKKNNQPNFFQNLVFKRQNYLSKDREYSCEECGEIFCKSVLFRKHVQTHPNYRRLCTVCGKTFINEYELKYHERVHTGNNAHECKDCGKTFARANKLTEHLRIHTGEKPFCCPFCEKTFAQLCHLLGHERTHTGERPYKCKHCFRSFSQTSTRNKHKKIHVGGAKMFQCKFCDRMFATSNELQLHCGRHNGDMPLKCEICSQRFNKPSLLKKHVH